MSERTAEFRPFGDRAYSITGAADDVGVIGELERSGGLYQRDLVQLLRHRLPADGVVVDGGAHIGVLSVLLAGLCPRGHVYAFEPAPANHEYLRANLAANGLTNATAVRCALLDREGDVPFAFNSAYPGGSHVGVEGQDALLVPGTRLDTWAGEVALARLDLLKLDLEGVEMAALAGAERTIKRFGPLTVVECNPVALARFGGAHYRDLWQRLRDLFGAVGAVGPGGRLVPVLSVRHLQLQLGREAVVDLVAFPRRPAGWWPAVAEAARGWRRLEREQRQAEPPPRTMIIEPKVGLTIWPRAVTGRAQNAFGVPVTVTNRGQWWLSSAFVHPVHATYRILDENGTAVVKEGHRTPLPRPLPPGASADLDLLVEMPAPGRYRLVLTLVQEHIAWFDELEPRASAEVSLTVSA